MAQDAAVRRGHTGEVNGRAAVAVLSYLGFTVLLLQVGIVPLLPAIGSQLGLTLGTVAWVLTAELLAGAVGLAVLTRLADLYGKRRIIVVCLTLVLAGSLLGAVTDSLAFLLFARVLMGAQAPMLALPEAIASDSMHPARARWTIATIHAGNSVGVAGGLVLGGLVGAVARDYHAFFWVAAITVAVGLVGTLLFVKETPYRAEGGFDLPGGFLLAGSLVAFLLGLSQGPGWGWSSPSVLGLFAAGLLLGWLWFVAERRARHPLVDVHVVAQPATRIPNVVVFLIAFGIYGAIAAVTRFAQTDPAAAGYGFGYSPLQTTLFAIPVAIGGLLAALTLRRVGGRIGFLGATGVSVALCTIAYVGLAAGHVAPEPMMASLGVYAVGNTMGIAAAQILVLRVVPPSQSGVALGVMIILYAIGNALGSTVVGVLFAALRAPGIPIPAASAYTTAFALCGVSTGVAAFLCWFAWRGRGRSAVLPAPGEPANFPVSERY